jgi:hypothetical protein
MTNQQLKDKIQAALEVSRAGGPAGEIDEITAARLTVARAAPIMLGKSRRTDTTLRRSAESCRSRSTYWRTIRSCSDERAPRPRAAPPRPLGPLGALQQGKGVLGLLGLTDQLVALGVSYRFHGLLIREALQRKDDAGIIVQLVQVVDKLERGVT